MIETLSCQILPASGSFSSPVCASRAGLKSRSKFTKPAFAGCIESAKADFVILDRYFSAAL